LAHAPPKAVHPTHPRQLGFRLSFHMSWRHCSMPAGVVPYPVSHSSCAKPLAEPQVHEGSLLMNE
jgi:hypothetical protein